MNSTLSNIFLNGYVHLGESIGQNPGYLKLRKIRASQAIARTVAQSPNKMYLSGNSLMLNINDSGFDEPMDRLDRKKHKL